MSTSSSTSSCRMFTIKEIKEATNEFDRSNILGQGGEAIVYFAEMDIDLNKTPVAVKRLKDDAQEFENEIKTISKVQHPNLVSLIGYCKESGHKILVYEYMSEGCLVDYVMKNKKSGCNSLSWLQRLSICLDAARGLQHLHTETDEFPKGIIHRDVKPGNILLGKNWVGKLSDFGMFKMSEAGQQKSLITTLLKGTSGYYAPEYIKNYRITRKIDVYAFGVVLFEVLCRKMPWDQEDESYYATEDEDLGLWAQQNIDAEIQEEISWDSLMLFTNVVGRSLHVNPGRRPTMDEVVLDLEKALKSQESENLARQLEVSDGFSTKPSRPWGGPGGENHYNYIGKGEISRISIEYETALRSIKFTSQDENGHLDSSRRIGSAGGAESAKIVLDTKTEKLVGISGTVGHYTGYTVITSLKFYTSKKRTFGPFGGGNGTPFSYMVKEGSSIIGFYGRDGGFLDSIGVHVQAPKS